jgi:hypothetical protein
MHLPTLPATASAWHIETIAYNFNGRGKMTYDSGSGFIDRDFNDGCFDRRLPGKWDFCMDWGNARGHFFQDGGSQSIKLCFRRTTHAWIRGPNPDQGQGGVRWSAWTPAACSWGRMPGNETEGGNGNVVEGDPHAPLLAPEELGPEYEPFVLDASAK